MILVTGGSSSGKSAYAESLLEETEYGNPGCKEYGVRYYIATMQVNDEEDRARVAKHHQMREGKGFYTIEKPVDLIDVLDEIRPVAGPGPGAASGSEARTGMERKMRSVALVECISNLTANEMFRDEGTESAGAYISADVVTDRIVEQVKALNDSFDSLIVVTNNVFEDGTEYEPSTMEYLRALGEINRQLAVRAERVVEVVAGIPVDIKDSDDRGDSKE